jgi:serine protease Do
MGAPHGSIIASLVPDGPGQAAGLTEGDVIVKFGNDTPTDTRALRRMIAVAKIGDTVPVSIWRDGKAQTIKATIQEWPDETKTATAEAAATEERPATTNPAQLGLHLEPITDEARAKFKLATGVSGVLVSDITHNSTASDQGLAAGDVIVKVQQERVSTPAEVQQGLSDALAQDHHHALLLVQKPDAQQWVTLPIGSGG